jgi:hypothetical protein
LDLFYIGLKSSLSLKKEDTSKKIWGNVWRGWFDSKACVPISKSYPIFSK